MITLYFLFCFPLTPSLASPNDVANIKESYDAKMQIASSVVTLKNGRKLIDVGYNLAYIGEMKFKSHSALLFKGVICADCGVDLSLFVLPLIPNARKTQFTFPGRITTNKQSSEGVSYKSSILAIKTFYGDCLNNHKSTLIHLKDNETLGTKNLEVWQLDDHGNLVFNTIEKDTALNALTAAIKSKKCTEIQSGNRDVNQ